MSKKVKINSIEIETKDGKKTSLTLAEAKELHEQLNGLFGKNIQYIPSQPIVIDRDRWLRDYRPFYNITSTTTDANTYQWCVSGKNGLSVSYQS